jgi:hypothetical protein
MSWRLIFLRMKILKNINRFYHKIIEMKDFNDFEKTSSEWIER